MPKYKLADGRIVTVQEKDLEITKTMKEFEGAVLIEDSEPGKDLGSTGTFVPEGPTNTVLDSEDGSLDSPEDISAFDKFLNILSSDPIPGKFPDIIPKFGSEVKPPSKEILEANDKEIIKKDIESGKSFSIFLFCNIT